MPTIIAICFSETLLFCNVTNTDSKVIGELKSRDTVSCVSLSSFALANARITKLLVNCGADDRYILSCGIPRVRVLRRDDTGDERRDLGDLGERRALSERRAFGDERWRDRRERGRGMGLQLSTRNKNRVDF